MAFFPGWKVARCLFSSSSSCCRGANEQAFFFYNSIGCRLSRDSLDLEGCFLFFSHDGAGGFPLSFSLLHASSFEFFSLPGPLTLSKFRVGHFLGSTPFFIRCFAFFYSSPLLLHTPSISTFRSKNGRNLLHQVCFDSPPPPSAVREGI